MLAEENPVLHFIIADNVVGPLPISTGIANRQSGIETVNGRLQMVSRRGDGTTVTLGILVFIGDGCLLYRTNGDQCG